MSRIAVFLFGTLSYAIGMGGLTFFILFVCGWSFMPININSASPIWTAPIAPWLVNLGLIALFGIQHSVSARPAFKAWLTRVVPQSAERSSYVLMSGLLMLTIATLWQPISGVIWQAETAPFHWLLVGIQVSGWVIAVVTTFLINHFELFGLQQVYHNLKRSQPPAPKFTERAFYRFVRHPLQCGFLIGLWATPMMTVSHAMLSTAMTVYIFIGLYFEERDLVATLGEDYEDYRRRVPMVVPVSLGR